MIILVIAPWSFAWAGDTHVCADCERATVAQAIVDAADGDTITIPAGECTWTSSVTIPDEKQLFIQGAGASSTIITSNVSGDAALKMGYSQSRVTGIDFYMPIATKGINVRGTGWRIDHCKFDNPSESNLRTGVFANGASPSPGDSLSGLIDSCDFIGSRIEVHADLNLMAHGVWAESLGLGTDSAVYVENCTFTLAMAGNAIDANYGGAYVFRYNTVNDTSIDCHSAQGNNRAARKWEIYNNEINQVSRICWTPMYIRGGTGVIFNNRITGTWTTENIVFNNVRSDPSYKDTHDGENNAVTLSDSGASLPYADSNYNPGALLKNFTDGSECVVTGMTAKTCECELAGGTDNDWDTGDEYGLYRKLFATIRPCDGTSDWDGNDVGVGNGWPCRDQIGRGPDNTLWDDDPAGEYDQSSAPAYVWNNIGSDGETIIGVSVAGGFGGSTAHIVENRDYYLSQHPTYTCYDCPHPLTGYTGSCDPNVSGVGGYNVGSRTITFTGSRTATSATGGSRTIVLKR